MASGPTFPALERSAFFDGQRLLADDLGSVLNYQRELRWLHNRTLHGWGIALGLDVSGEEGERSVRIEPGYAIDCRGRDIVLPRAIGEHQVPPVVGAADGSALEFYLTVSWVADEDLADAESRTGSCEGGGAVRRTEEPLLRWCDPNAVAPSGAVFRPGTDILLATVKVSGCKLAAVPDPARRRSLSAPHRPTVRGGRTPASATTWSAFPSTGTPVGVETHVDTTNGRFQSIPAYTAQLVGPWDVTVQGSSRIVAGWSQVANATAQGFDFRVYLPRDLQTGGQPVNHASVFSQAGLDALKDAAKWHVHWTGVED